MKLHFLPLAMCLAAVGIFLAACESEKSGTGDDVLDVYPSYAKLRAGQSVTLTAKGGSDYLWSLSNEEIGSLSSRHGSSVVYTAQVCEGANTFQTVTAQSKLTGGIVTTNGNSLASGTATILHCGSEE